MRPGRCWCCLRLLLLHRGIDLGGDDVLHLPALQLLAVELGLGPALGDDLRVRGGVERLRRGADAGGAVVEGQSVAGVELGEVHIVHFLGAKPARKKA